MKFIKKHKAQINKQNLLSGLKESVPVRQKSKRVFGYFLHFLPYLVVFSFGAIILLILVLLSAFSPYYQKVNSAYHLAISGANAMNKAQAKIMETDFFSAEKELKTANEDFVKSLEDLRKAQESVVFKLPYLKTQIFVAGEVLQSGAEISQSLIPLTSLGAKVEDVFRDKEFSWKNLSPEKKVVLLGLLKESTDDFRRAHGDFENINERLVNLKKNYPQTVFSEVIDKMAIGVPLLQKTFSGLLLAGEILPEISGFDVSKNYLLLFLNNREIRPGGGFIGTYGVLSVKDAEIKRLEIDNIYNFDKLAEKNQKIEPPKPIKEYLKMDSWYLRDSNWSPDFAISSQKVLEFYRLQGGMEKMDGVLAFTVTVIEELMRLIGDIEIQGLKFTADNFYDVLQYEVEYGYAKRGIAFENRKDIIRDLTAIIISRVENFSLDKILEIYEIAKNGVVNKNILAYSVNSGLQKKWEDYGLAGRVLTADDDYLLVVDANLAALKTDAVMDRTIKYNLTEQEGKFLAKLEVNYQNNGTFSWKTTRYRTYSRYYLPQGVRISEVKVGEKVLKPEEYDFAEDLQKNFVGFFFEVEPKTTKTISIIYSLPDRLFEKYQQSNQYKLNIQKQLGLEKINLQLNFDFEKKPKSLVNLNLLNDTVLTQVLEMTQDQNFQVSF